jgi:two-component system chemotaxis sensor kinase CheA
MEETMNLDVARHTFAEEAGELLEAMEQALLSLEQTPEEPDLLQQVFRAMHTIKGTAGVFGYEPIVAFTHTVETVMDAVRCGERALEEVLIATLLECRDHTAALVQAVLAADDPMALDPELLGAGDVLVARLAGPGNALQPTDQPAPGDGTVEKLVARAQDADHWVIALDFGADALRNGMDPLSFLRYLRSLGDIVQILTLSDRLPPASQFDPENCYLGFRILFQSEADKQTIEGVFEFAEDDCDIRILPPDSKQEHYQALLDALPDDQVARLGEMLTRVGALTAKEVEAALSAQSAAVDPDKPARRLGEILVEQHSVRQPVVDQALKKQDKAKERAAQEARYIRVDSARLGHLINLVGELVIGSAAMRVMVQRHGLDDVQEVVDQVEHLVEEIRDNALQLRMVQIGDTFSRFRRVVRDASRDLGKEIELVITGGETELDKTVVEKINDPLTHLVRNAVDHGIEQPQDRIARGKPAQGTVRLNAFHDSGHIVIEIRDDGAGLDPERIRAKAEARDLIRPDQVLTREETLRLIFEPGLSTREQASSLSGRGVGMDVVRRNIEALRGTVELDSEPGKGTTVTIVLPLTLAIIDGFLVGSGSDQYVIPLAQVVECVELDDKDAIQRRGHQYVNLRGEVLPYLRLRDFFQGGADGDRRVGRESLVVVRFGHSKAGLVVDSLFGELQTVIKPLGRIFEQIEGVAGATVLGTGGIALILDVQELSNLAHVRAGLVTAARAGAQAQRI